VIMAGGNHDAWGGRFLREHVGISYHTEPFHCELGGARSLVAHGDGLGRGDFKYRALKAVIRSRAAIGAFRVLHPELGLRLARAVSTTHEKADDDLAAEGRARFLESWATEQLSTDASLRYVVCGHSHLPVVREHQPGRWYINAGDWISHFTYVTVDSTGPVLRHWKDAGAGAASDAAGPLRRPGLRRRCAPRISARCRRTCGRHRGSGAARRWRRSSARRRGVRAAHVELVEHFGDLAGGFCAESTRLTSGAHDIGDQLAQQRVVRAAEDEHVDIHLAQSGAR
jgi:predicted phosphodiesterase